jgi:hemerythrin
MFKIHWTDDLEIGVDILDQQHRHIVDLFNRIGEAHLRGEITVAHQLFYELIGFKLSHCAYEEDLLKQSDFPLYKMHKLSHELVISKCLTLYNRIEESEHALREAIPLLGETLVRHIKGEDADYANFIREAQRNRQKTGRGLLYTLKRVFK